MSQEVIIDIKPKEKKLGFYLIFLLFLVVLASIVFFASFFATRIAVQNKVFGEKTSQTASSRPGWLLLSTNDYSIEYPENWKAETHQSKEAAGARLFSSAGEVNFWLGDLREPRFSKEQQKSILSEKPIEISVDKRKAAAIKYNFKDGSFFLAIKVPANSSTKNVIFWSSGSNKETEKIVISIVTSYKSK
jgi:hypothetical protein